MSEPVVVLTSMFDVNRLALKSPKAAAAAREYFEKPKDGQAVVVTWKGTGRGRHYVITAAVTAGAFARE